MKHSVTKSKDLTVVSLGAILNLKIVPLTFMKLIDINEALGEGKTLDKVLVEPTVLDLAIVTYCLLDDKSIEKLEKVEVEINKEQVKPTQAQKLFYIMSANNIADGMDNYSSILKAVVEQLQDSMSQEPKKKRFRMV